MLREVPFRKVGDESNGYRRYPIPERNRIETFIYNLDNTDNMAKKDKVKVELDRDIVNELIKRKKVGNTYSDIIRGLLKHSNP